MVARELTGRRLGDFVVGAFLAEGGYGVVYRCEQVTLKRAAVIKVLHARRQRNDLALKRFRREALLASRLSHTYAAHVYAYGIEDDGLVWIAMELVEGPTLDEWLATHGPMTLAQFVPFFKRVAEVVQSVHARGIVHCDLKPSNVMVSEREDGLHPKLLDFGIAKAEQELAASAPDVWPDSSLAENRSPHALDADEGKAARVRAVERGASRTRTRRGPAAAAAGAHPVANPGPWIGSRPYMSPEQWADPQAVGPATDIYSLGIVMYEALTGRVPFLGPSSDEYYQRHLNAEVPPLGAAVPVAVDRMIRKALAKSPASRQRDCLELASELDAALRADPRERLRVLAEQWRDRGRSPDLLSRGQMLAELEHVASNTEKVSLTELECSFIADSQRRARRLKQARRGLAALAVVGTVGVVQYRAVMEARMDAQHAILEARAARQVADAIAMQGELEQGRADLLHGEPEAASHLAAARRMGDRSSSLEFMFARALEPRLAEQAKLTGSAGRVWSATFSPDGRNALTTDDQNAQVWDLASSKTRFALHHGDTVYQAIYLDDGKHIASAGGDGTVKIWSAAGGALDLTLKGRRQALRYGAVAEQAARKVVAAIDVRGAVADVWDATTGALLAELPSDGHDFFSIAFSHDGRWLATSGGSDVQVYDVGTWKLARKITGQRRLSWDPTGPRLLTGSAGGDVALWTIPTGKRLRHLREIGEPINRVAFSPDGALVVAASGDGAEQVWDARTGVLRSQGNFIHGKILSIEFDHTSTQLVASGASGSVAVSDANQGELITMIDGSRNVAMTAHFDPADRRILGSSWDGTARVWDAAPPYRRWSTAPASTGCDLVPDRDPDRSIVVVGCRDQGVKIWDTARTQLLGSFPAVIDGDNNATYPAVTANGDRVAIVRSRQVDVYDVAANRKLATFDRGAAVSAISFAAAGHDLAVGAADGSLVVVHDNGITSVLPAGGEPIEAVALLNDGRIVSADAQRRLRIHDSSGALVATLQMTASVSTFRLSPDQRRLVTLPNSLGTVAAPELWDLTGYRRIAILEEHGQGPVYSARFVTNEQVVTACGDGAARLWTERGQLGKTYPGKSRLLVDATLSSDGAMLVTAGHDGILRFWDVASGRQLWMMPAHKTAVAAIRIAGNDIVTRGYLGDISMWRLPPPGQVIDACEGRDRCAIVSK